jgi:DNA-binding MarR family transcriptional regulator
VCNKIFASGNKKITLQDAQTAAFELLNQNEPVFFQYRTMLTANQWNMLRAIAKEGTVYQPHAQKLIQKYNLGTPSSVQRNVEALLNKEMIYKLSDDKSEYYRVYDCFLMRWLERS